MHNLHLCILDNYTELLEEMSSNWYTEGTLTVRVCLGHLLIEMVARERESRCRAVVVAQHLSRAAVHSAGLELAATKLPPEVNLSRLSI